MKSTVTTPDSNGSGKGKAKGKVAVDYRAYRAVHETMKAAHLHLKRDIKALGERFKRSGKEEELKGFVLVYPPLVALNSLLEDVDNNTVNGAKCSSPFKSPDATPTSSKRPSSTEPMSASKSLRFSPRVVKIEPGKYAATSGKKEHNTEEDDDVVEVAFI